MVCFKGLQQDGGLYFSVVDVEDALAELGSSFLVHHSLHKPKAAQVPTIEPSSFAHRFSIRVERGADDGSEAYYSQSVCHDMSSLIPEFFLCSGVKLLSGRLDGGRICFYIGSFAISLFNGN